MEVVEGIKAGSRYYVYEDYYLYRVNTKVNETLYLICTKDLCNARAMIKNGNFVMNPRQQHSHPSEPEEVQKCRFRESLLASSCKTDVSVKQIYNSVAESHSAAAALYPYASAEWRMRKKRRSEHPPVAQDLFFVHDYLESEDWGHLGQTILTPQRPFYKCLLQTEEGAEILVFMSPEISDILNYTDIIHIDGTFKIVPHGLKAYQLTTIHVVYQDKVYPAVYALMSHRTKAAYLSLLEYVKSIYTEMKPSQSMTDYEIAERQAISEAFPGIQNKGCWFHFAQAVWKKHQELGLCTFTQNEVCRRILQMLMSLPLLPADKIVNGIQFINSQIIRANIVEEFSPMMQYMSDFWINRVQPAMISVHGCTRRTNNDVENFHSQIFQQNMKKVHPSFWDFVRILRETDRNYSLKYLAHRNGATHSRKQRASSKRQTERIREAEEKLMSGSFNVREFLEATCHSVATLERQLRFQRSRNSMNIPDTVSESVDDPQPSI